MTIHSLILRSLLCDVKRAVSFASRDVNVMMSAVAAAVTVAVDADAVREKEQARQGKAKQHKSEQPLNKNKNSASWRPNFAATDDDDPSLPF